MIKLKPLISENMPIRRSDTKNPDFLKGMRLAIRDRGSGQERSDVFFKEMGKDFNRGYQSVMNSQENTGFWNKIWPKINDRLTDLAAMMGRSYGNR
jgi:hypothetical protein